MPNSASPFGDAGFRELRAGAVRDVHVAGPSAQHAVRPADLDPATAGDLAAAIRRAMREAEPAQPTAAHRTSSYALASGLHQPKRKQKIIGREDMRGPERWAVDSPVTLCHVRI